MIDIFKIVLVSIICLTCKIKDVQDFYCNHIDIFENNWWKYSFEGNDECFNVYDGYNTVWLYDIEVFPDGDCYELELWEGVISDTVCECPVEPDWREPYELQSFDHNISNSF
jgi:hypothetical protein